MRTIAPLFISLWLVTGCSGKDNDKKKNPISDILDSSDQEENKDVLHSCSKTDTVTAVKGTCVNYYSTFKQSDEQNKFSCKESEKGIYSKEECSTKNAVGACRTSKNSSALDRARVFYKGDESAKGAEEYCSKLKGEWTPYNVE